MGHDVQAANEQLRRLARLVPERRRLPLHTIPDTFVESDAVDGALITRAEADLERTVYVFGRGDSFVEADGTSYSPSGSPTGPGEVSAVMTSGAVEVSGLTVEVDGPLERTYTFVVTP